MFFIQTQRVAQNIYNLKMLGNVELILLFANYTIGSYFIIFPWAYYQLGFFIYLAVTVVVMTLYNMISRMILE